MVILQQERIHTTVVLNSCLSFLYFIATNDEVATEEQTDDVKLLFLYIKVEVGELELVF